ncbi:winged helix DNA-binding domain-containing protein [Actinophytocola oryzae]|uniref:Winged helix DNA-binding protein n=1 Tax=Actinophytocola oryzae TaxID=502181 RepID=A0A4R7W3B2_9PSEU|nr:winged helix DNA-binding domain-containing protein [Actinophytocola oryzae]TDV57130.1 winged helix DNA-binding protein [Actinophytocola oryzae]
MTTMTWAQVCARRLDRHGLATPLTGGPADVVSSVAGTHGQVMSAAEISIALRLENATRETVRTAVRTGELVKAFGPRGTVHLLPAAELPNWFAALAAVPTVGPSHPRSVQMTCAQFDQVLAAIAAAVRGAELTVDELSDAVVAATGPWAGDRVMEAFGGKWPRWRQALPTAGTRGLLCFGPNRGRNATYTSPPTVTAEQVDPLPWLLSRYLHAFGPSTPARFANWLNTSDTWARDLFESTDLEPVTVDGEELWVERGDTALPAEPPSGVRLLPYFDTYAYAVGNDRHRLNPGTAATRARGNFQVLLTDGLVGGVWHQKRTGRRVAVTVEPFTRLTKPRLRDLEAQVNRIGMIVGASPTLTIGEVSMGGHA